VEQRNRGHSPEWYAAKILNEIDLVRKVIALGETATVAHLAINLGYDIGTAEFKFRWEPDIEKSLNMPKYGQEGGLTSGANRRATHVAERKKVQEAADILWQEQPNLQDNNTDTARELIRLKKTTRRLHTVRGYLSKPETWSNVKKKCPR